MKPLIAKSYSWGITCEDIGFFYQMGPVIPDFDVEIFGTNELLPKYLGDSEIASIDGEHNYLLLFACLRKKAEEFETIRRCRKPVIVICGIDFDFIEDVEQYVAAGAVVMHTNKLRKKA